MDNTFIRPYIYVRMKVYTKVRNNNKILQRPNRSWVRVTVRCESFVLWVVG